MIAAAWRMLARRSDELCAVLEVSQPAISNMLRRASSYDLGEAARVVAELERRL